MAGPPTRNGMTIRADTSLTAILPARTLPRRTTERSQIQDRTRAARPVLRQGVQKERTMQQQEGRADSSPLLPFLPKDVDSFADLHTNNHRTCMSRKGRVCLHRVPLGRVWLHVPPPLMRSQAAAPVEVFELSTRAHSSVTGPRRRKTPHVACLAGPCLAAKGASVVVQGPHRPRHPHYRRSSALVCPRAHITLPFAPPSMPQAGTLRPWTPTLGGLPRDRLGAYCAIHAGRSHVGSVEAALLYAALKRERYSGEMRKASGLWVAGCGLRIADCSRLIHLAASFLGRIQ